MPLQPCELILNQDGSIYHLNLLPKDIATTIITVGDPDRVAQVSKHFDSIEVQKEKREFRTHTGTKNGKRITVISTGIGTGNMDIVLNELDALANIDFKTKTPRKKRIRLQIVRIGTSGAIQSDIPVDSFMISEKVIGFDGLIHCYERTKKSLTAIEDAFIAYTDWHPYKARPYVLSYNFTLGRLFEHHRIRLGFTATKPGFYGPQQRMLCIAPCQKELYKKIASFTYLDSCITNLEMETSALYALAQLMGHQAVSLNCILANRATGEFSQNPQEAIDTLIKLCLDKLCFIYL